MSHPVGYSRVGALVPINPMADKRSYLFPGKCLSLDKKVKTISSYYKSSVNVVIDAGPLTSDQATQVCVIGGGFTGVNTALELAERGVDVVLLEANEIGWGASGRNGGQMICGIGHDPDLIRKQLAANEFSRLYGMGLEAVQTLTQRIKKYAIECGFNWGYCTVA